MNQRQPRVNVKKRLVVDLSADSVLAPKCRSGAPQFGGRGHPVSPPSVRLLDVWLPPLVALNLSLAPQRRTPPRNGLPGAGNQFGSRTVALDADGG